MMPNIFEERNLISDEITMTKFKKKISWNCKNVLQTNSPFCPQFKNALTVIPHFMTPSFHFAQTSSIYEVKITIFDTPSDGRINNNRDIEDLSVPGGKTLDWPTC